MTTYEKGKLYDLPIIDLKPDPAQPRKSLDPQALEELAASIRLQGIIQPLLFRQGEAGWLYIVAGERRYQAAKNIGLLIVPGICVEGKAAEIALIENVQRQDLTCIEEAEALKRLMDEEGYNQEQVADVIGKSPSAISESLSLTNLPQEIRDECRGDRTVSKKRLLEISRKKQQRAMNTAYAKYREELQKELAGGAKTRQKLTPAASLCQTLDKAREKLDKTDLADWSDDDIRLANEAVNSLRESLDNFTNPPPSPPPSMALS